MASTSKFELYIKKHIFTTFLLILGMGIFYGVYISITENSLDFYYARMKEYSKRLEKLKKQSLKIEDKFKDLKSKIQVVGKVNYRLKCDNNLEKHNSIYSLVR